MGELTIEAKAKAYDYAVNKAKELILNENGVVRVDKPLFDELFPSEMEESEDERIRKVLVELISTYLREHENGKIHDVYAKNILAWLDKQGEHGVSPLFTFEDVLAIQCAMAYAKFQDRELDVALKKLHDKVYDAYHDSINHNIESQDGLKGEQILANSAKTCKDEQKPNPYSGISFDYDGHTWGMCARDNGIELFLDGELKAFLSLEKSFIYPIHSQSELAPKSALEAAKEEKVDNANKVEPKDYNDIDPHFGKPIDKVVPKFKVGDWVVWDNKISCHIDNIYQGKESLMYSITDVHNMTRSYSVKGFDNNAHLWDITKDAKDGDVLKEGSCIFILRKMKSKNTAITHCCLFDDGDFNLSPTLSLDVDSTFPATKEQRDILFAKMKEEGYVWDAEKKEPKKIEQKPAWSEEDEKIIQWIATDIKRLINDNKKANIIADQEIKWLESLRPRSQWKPSEEQIGALEHFVRSIAESGFASPYDSNTKLVYSLFNDLKKLREE